MNPELATLSLPELVSRLRDLHTMRTPIGWPTDSAVTKSSVERRIFELVAREPTREGHDDPAERIMCDLAVKLRRADRPSVTASGAELRVGGLFVPVAADNGFAVGQAVELEVVTDNDYRLRVRSNVDWLAHGHGDQPAGVGLGFHTVVGDGPERRVERLVQELLRNRVER